MHGDGSKTIFKMTGYNGSMLFNYWPEKITIHL